MTLDHTEVYVVEELLGRIEDLEFESVCWFTDKSDADLWAELLTDEFSLRYCVFTGERWCVEYFNLPQGVHMPGENEDADDRSADGANYPAPEVGPGRLPF